MPTRSGVVATGADVLTEGEVDARGRVRVRRGDGQPARRGDLDRDQHQGGDGEA